MCGKLVALLLPLLLAVPALGQTAHGNEPPCVDIRIGTEPTYNCTNAQLGLVIPPRRFDAGNDLPVAASSPGPAAGAFNQAAAAEQLGTAFGKSTQPQRPPPAEFQAPLPAKR